MRARLLQDSQLRFYLAMAFLLWSVLPHFSVYRHAHTGSSGHEHATLTPAQVQLANQVALALPADAEPDFGGESVPLSRSGAEEPSLNPDPEVRIHAHFQQDPNVHAQGIAPRDIAPDSPPALFLSARPSAPDLGWRFEQQARGPPSLPSART